MHRWTSYCLHSCKLKVADKIPTWQTTWIPRDLSEFWIKNSHEFREFRLVGTYWWTIGKCYIWPVPLPICGGYYAGRKILYVSVAQPQTCHHRTGDCLWEAVEEGLWVSQDTRYPFQAVLRDYSGKFWVAQPGHTQILRPCNLWHNIFLCQTIKSDAA